MAVDTHALKLGPEGFRKIAIVGSAPSSMRLGPYADQSWAIWACSPGVYGEVPRKDVWFEIHRWEPPVAGDGRNPNNKPWFSPEYVQFINEFPGPVFLAGPDPEDDHPVRSVKNGWRFPFEDHVARHGDYFFSSTMAWMLSLAIETLLAKRADINVPEAGEAIGLWGVDMAASEEYSYQRPGCQHFLGLAESLGIPVILPPESDLMQPPPLYGICEYLPRHMKNLARLGELHGREAILTAQIGAMSQELAVTRGAIGNQKYFFNTWVGERDPGWSIKSAVSLAGVGIGRPKPEEAAVARFEPEPPPLKYFVDASKQLDAAGDRPPPKPRKKAKPKRR